MFQFTSLRILCTLLIRARGKVTTIFYHSTYTWLIWQDIRQCLSFLFFGLELLLLSQPVAVYHLTHSITSAVGSLLPEVSHLIPCFHSGLREWESHRMGRLALSPEEHTPALSAQQRQRKLCPNFFLHNQHTRTLCRHARSSHITQT